MRRSIARRSLPTRSLALVAIMAVAGAAMPAAAAPTPAAEGEVVRQLALEHVALPDAMTMLRSILDMRRLSPNPSGDAIVVRDSPAKVEAAARLLAMFDRPAAEVEVDVQRLVVDAAALAELVRAAGDGSPVRVPTERLADLAVGEVRRLTSLSAVSGESARFRQEGAGAGAPPDATDLNLSIEPKVHGRSGEVSLAVSAKAFPRDEQGSVGGFRSVTSSLRLGDGDSYLVVGLLPEGEDAHRLPVLALTPRIVRGSAVRPEDLELVRVPASSGSARPAASPADPAASAGAADALP